MPTCPLPPLPFFLNFIVSRRYPRCCRLWCQTRVLTNCLCIGWCISSTSEETKPSTVSHITKSIPLLFGGVPCGFHYLHTNHTNRQTTKKKVTYKKKKNIDNIFQEWNSAFTLCILFFIFFFRKKKTNKPTCVYIHVLRQLLQWVHTDIVTIIMVHIYALVHCSVQMWSSSIHKKKSNKKKSKQITPLNSFLYFHSSTTRFKSYTHKKKNHTPPEAGGRAKGMHLLYQIDQVHQVCFYWLFFFFFCVCMWDEAAFGKKSHSFDVYKYVTIGQQFVLLIVDNDAPFFCSLSPRVSPGTNIVDIWCTRLWWEGSACCWSERRCGGGWVLIGRLLSCFQVGLGGKT